MIALKIENLSRSFDSFKLDNLSLSLPSGCIMGLIGENGAGKSTTFRLILDILRKEDGKVTFFEQEDIDPLSLREEIGVVLDEPGIPGCMNAAQLGKVLRLTYRSWNDSRYQDLLDRFDVPQNKEFQALSRGNQMKLSVAAAMAHDPKLLILDEATSALDPVVRDDLMQLLNDFTRDERCSVLVSSHIVSDLEKICDYIAFLHKGKLLLCEEKDRLISEYGIIRCSESQLNEYPQDVILHSKTTPFGAEAIIRRSSMPPGAEISPVSIEDLFIYMVKGERSL